MDRIDPEAARAELLSAWAAHDEVALKWGDKYMRVGSATLARESFRMLAAAGDFASSLGMRTTEFEGLCHAFRRAGFDREQSVRAIEVAVEDRKVSHG